MRFRHPFMYGPEGGKSSDSSEAALEHTFGPLSGIRPDLAANEAHEAEQRAKGKAPLRSLEMDRPVLDSEQTPDGAEETTEVKKPAAARVAPPAADSTEGGSDLESPDDEDATLEAIVNKYQGKPQSMAKAVKGLRTLQTKTAEEKKALEDQLETALNVIDNDYDWVEGKPVLKSDVAARHMRNGQGRPKGPIPMPAEQDIRAEVTEEFRKAGEDVFNEDQIPAYLTKYKPLIEAQVSERMKTAKIQVEAARYNMLAEVGNIVERHLRQHPEDKEIIGEIDAMYAGVPEELRAASVLEEWMPFGKMAELVRVKAKLPAMIKEAYELGKKHRGEAGKVTEPGVPGRSRPTPPNGRGVSADVAKSIKEGIVNSTSGLPSIDSILA